MAATSRNFLDLPAEVRVVVYESLFQGARLKKAVNQTLRWMNGQPHILLVCHKIRKEAGPVLSASTTYELTDYTLKRSPVPRKYLRGVRSIIIGRHWLHVLRTTAKMLDELPALQVLMISCMERLGLDDDEDGREMFLTRNIMEDLGSYHPADPGLLMSKVGDKLVSEAARKILEPYNYDLGGLESYRDQRESRFKIYLQFWIYINGERSNYTVGASSPDNFENDRLTIGIGGGCRLRRQGLRRRG